MARKPPTDTIFGPKLSDLTDKPEIPYKPVYRSKDAVYRQLGDVSGVMVPLFDGMYSITVKGDADLFWDLSYPIPNEITIRVGDSEITIREME